MPYIKCPTCKELLGNRILIYEDQLNKIENMNVSFEKKHEMKQELLQKLVERYCCRQRLLTSINVTALIK